MTKRVVLADDMTLFRQLLAQYLTGAGYHVVGQAEDGKSLRDMVSALHPDLAVVDIRMPPAGRLEGLETAVWLRARHPGVAVLLLSEYLEAAHLATLVGGQATGVGYLLKNRVSDKDFLAAVERVAGGGCAVDPEVVSLMLATRRRDGSADLTPREREVLALMAEGWSNQAIADRLHLTPKTVETHIRSIFQSLGLATEAEHHRRVLAVLTYLRST
ncbi:response regulator transcription factor [Saccharothrix sp.]|uniref:response regulator transcription factor n=1 Tax=Saccharothrix sp. TaxID=1873460 RepID=UPI002811789E|nr:response regulator transcription factor [Saccharothrix sp.]